MIKHKKQFRVFILVGLFALTHTFGHAQRFYTGLSVGYGFPLASQNIPKDWGDKYIEIGAGAGVDGFLYTKAQRGSYGSGIKLNVMLGYNVTDNIGVELEAGYLFGELYTLSKTEADNLESFNTNGNMLRIIPTIRYRIHKGRFSPFVRLGLVVGVLGKVQSERTSLQVAQHVEWIYLYTGGVSLGASLSIGTDFKITNRIACSASMAFVGQSFSPSKGELVKFDWNGEDKLQDLSVKEREIRFVDIYAGSGAAIGSEPQEAPRLWYPFSSVGLNIGVTYFFNINSKK